MPRSESTLLSRYHQLLEVLASLARNSHEVQAVVQAVHQQAGTLFPSQVTLLALRQSDGDWRWELREDGQRFTQLVPFSPEGIMETVLNGEALAIADIDAYLEEHPVRVRRMTRGDDVIADVRQGDAPPDPAARSMLFVPLEIHGKRAGVLSIQSYEIAAFDDTDLEFLNLLGQHVAIALENAGLREELARLTRTDTLTGLHNRRAFSQDVPAMMEAARQGGRALSLVMLDVHEFKQINDAHGHHTGDVVLTTVGQLLTQALPAPDAAFRLSGDEFALLVWDAAERLGGLATRLTQALRGASWPVGLGPVCLQGGVAQLPPGAGLDGWLALADTRMYQAKRQRMVGNQVDWGLDFGHAMG